jgi:hypothetical protein
MKILAASMLLAVLYPTAPNPPVDAYPVHFHMVPMLRTLLAICLISGTAAHAQAPIERQPPAAPDPAWQSFAQRRNLRPGNELRIQAYGRPFRCHLDRIGANELDCTLYGSPSLFFPQPDIPYRIPRADIREVRTGGRDASTLLGFGVGFGLGAAAISGNPDITGKAAPILLFGSLLGALGAYIGHHLPLKGRTLYRTP